LKSIPILHESVQFQVALIDESSALVVYKEDGPEPASVAPEQSDVPTCVKSNSDPEPPTAVSSTSTDVKPPTAPSNKKKKVQRKRKKPAPKFEAKKPKTQKPLKSTQERRGPVLHIKGSRDSPISVKILNGPRCDDDDVNQSRVRAPISKDIRRARARAALYVSSALSSKYDSRTVDPSWVCVFCKLGPHQSGLGDLFGPYVVSREETSDVGEDSADEIDIADMQRRGGRNKRSIRANNLVEHFQKMSGMVSNAFFRYIFKKHISSHIFCTHTFSVPFLFSSWHESSSSRS